MTWETITGSLYRATFELLHIELGSDKPLTSQSYENLGLLTAKLLAEHIWQLASEEQIQLITDTKIHPPRTDDREFMLILVAGVTDPWTLQHINTCRLYLRAFHLPDIMDASGHLLLDDAWTGYNPLNEERRESW